MRHSTKQKRPAQLVPSSALYSMLYTLGSQVLRIIHRSNRAFKKIMCVLERLLYGVLNWLLLRHLRHSARNIRRFFDGFGIAATRLRESASHGFFHMLGTLFSLPFRCIRRHARGFCTLGNLLLPLAAAAVLLFTVGYWANIRYVMEVEYQGKQLGYIDRADVFTSGAELAANRVVSLDTTPESDSDNPPATDAMSGISTLNGLLSSRPTLWLTANRDATLMDVNTLCDRLLETAGDTIAPLSGLYVNGNFEGAVESRTSLDTLLSDILKNYSIGSANERAEFVQKVEIIDGLFPSSAAVSTTDLKKRLTAQRVVDKYYEVQTGNTLSGIARKFDMTLSEILGLNPSIKDAESIRIGDKILVQRAQPYLQVQVVRTIVYEEEIAYTTKKVTDSSKYVTYEHVRTSGKKGTQQVTAEVVYLDGVEQSRKVIATKVTKKPVERVIVVGTKEINPNASSGEATGRLIWPVPGHYYITSDFGAKEGLRDYRAHKGIDISSGSIRGASIVAADGGRVIEAGYHWSYGNYVRIDHGGGLVTMYEHCSKLLVSRGDKVKQGEVIAKVGSTGYSTGPHLHFQVEQNGSIVSPWKYVSRR